MNPSLIMFMGFISFFSLMLIFSYLRYKGSCSEAYTAAWFSGIVSIIFLVSSALFLTDRPSQFSLSRFQQEVLNSCASTYGCDVEKLHLSFFNAWKNSNDQN